VRDQRFDWKAPEQYRLAQEAEANAFLARLGDLAPIKETLRHWWRSEALRETDKDEEDSILRASLERFSHSCASHDEDLRVLAQAIPDIILRHGEDTPIRRGAGVMVGEVLGAVLAAGPADAAAFDRVASFLRRSWPALARFFITFLSEIPTASKPDWASCLGTFPTELPALLGYYARRDAVPIDTLVESERKARERGLVHYMWDRHDERCILKEIWTSRAKVLLPLAPEKFATVVEALPLHELREYVLHTPSLAEDRDAILGRSRPRSCGNLKEGAFSWV
jgi:hypothetical protein